MALIKQATVIQIILIFFLHTTKCQNKIQFKSADSILITADFYKGDKTYPYILLFHQAGYSRGEYNETAKKLAKLGYNCLAVDLRSGDEVNYTKNETAEMAKKAGASTEYFDAYKDIQSAICYTEKKCKTGIILFGSSYSASLCLLAAKNNPRVDGVIAFSPGEYFLPNLKIRNEINGFNKPLFVTATTKEYEYIKEMLSDIPSNLVTIFKPKADEGLHGAKALWESNPSNEEYWLALMLFIRNI